jgi:hypothetical protein
MDVGEQSLGGHGQARRAWTHDAAMAGKQCSPLARQSCDRDYNTRKEAADAAKNQNIVEFGHGLPRKAPAKASRGSKSMRKEI